MPARGLISDSDSEGLEKGGPSALKLGLGACAVFALGLFVGVAIPWHFQYATPGASSETPEPIVKGAGVLPAGGTEVVPAPGSEAAADADSFCKMQSDREGSFCFKGNGVRCCVGNWDTSHACEVTSCGGVECVGPGLCAKPVGDAETPMHTDGLTETDDDEEGDEPDCETADEEDECYAAVIKAMEHGSPADYPGLNASSSFTDFQQLMHLGGDEYPGKCAAPCLADDDDEGTVTIQETVGAFCRRMRGFGSWCWGGRSVRCCGGAGGSYVCGNVACRSNRCTGSGICFGGSTGGDVDLDPVCDRRRRRRDDRRRRENDRRRCDRRRTR